MTRTKGARTGALDLSSAKVLLIVGTPATGEAALEALRAAGCDVVVAGRRRDSVLADAERTHPDLLVVEASRKEASEAVESVFEALEIPALYLVDDFEPSTLASLRTPAALGFVKRPLDPEELCVAVRVALDRRKERRTADEQRRTSATLFHGLIETSPIATLIVGLDHSYKIEHMNRRFTEMFGYTLEHVWDVQSWWPRAYPDPVYQEQVRTQWTRAVESAFESERSTITAVEARVTCLDGSERHVEVHMAKYADRGIVLFSDLTEYKKTERELLDARSFLQAVVDQSPSMIFVVDAKGRAVFVNRCTADYYGTTPEQIVAKSTEEVHQDAAEASDFANDDREVIRSGQRIVREEVNTAPDGKKHWFHTVKVPLQRPDGSVDCLGISTDITDLRRAERERLELESRMQQAERLESLGVLAGGVAHDFNNLLTAILGNSSLVSDRLPPDSPLRPFLRDIESATRRAAELTQQMLAYAGRKQLVMERIRLDQLVAEMSSLLRALVSKKVSLQQNLSPASLEGDATQVRQVVMNFITNASDALEGRAGVISISTGAEHLATDSLHGSPLPEPKAGLYSFVEVRDEGSGMDQATLDRIFEPFFTTKFAGRGLGLAAALGIVKNHGGSLSVKSNPALGSVFTAYFPAAAEASSERPSLEQAASSGGSGTILVVDDEEIIRTLVRRTLVRAGFDVLLAADGREALAVHERQAPNIAAIVLDLTMPIMDGWEVLERLDAGGVETPVLVISGDANAPLPASSNAGRRTLLAKPFAPRELLLRLEQLLARARAPAAL